MRSPLPALSVTCAAALALAACTADKTSSGNTVESTHTEAVHSVQPAHAAGGSVRYGDSFALMSQQYTRRAGPYAGTGASAWVAPAPPPAFVASGSLSPADTPAPTPAAVANLQPAAPAATPAPASQVVRPEAVEANAGADARDPAVRTAGLALFNANSCGACHAFGDAGSSGGIGPSLDTDLAVRTIVNILNEGRGAMPSFKGQLSDAEILTLANYIHQFSR